MVESIEKRNIEIPDWIFLCLRRITADHVNNFQTVIILSVWSNRITKPCPKKLSTLLVNTDKIPPSLYLGGSKKLWVYLLFSLSMFKSHRGPITLFFYVLHMNEMLSLWIPMQNYWNVFMTLWKTWNCIWNDQPLHLYFMCTLPFNYYTVIKFSISITL